MVTLRAVASGVGTVLRAATRQVISGTPLNLTSMGHAPVSATRADYMTVVSETTLVG